MKEALLCVINDWTTSLSLCHLCIKFQVFSVVTGFVRENSALRPLGTHFNSSNMGQTGRY